MSTVTSGGIGEGEEYQATLGADDEEDSPLPLTLHFPENGETSPAAADIVDPFGAF